MPFLLVAGLLIAGCENVNLPFGLGQNGGVGLSPTAQGRSVELVERDIEAPEVFQVTEAGLWDGRPSLGGVWVAHPDVRDPERVIIRNQENGTFVIGALFRRERENPGPALQVSSDAAATLQMLAGAPATLNVTALRREETAAESPGAISDFGAETLPSPVTAGPLDDPSSDSSDATVASAAAAIVSGGGTAPPETASALDRPYIQLGIFSIEANAASTAQLMQGNDIAARVVRQEGQAGPFWRVIAGPARTEAERTALLDRVTALGFADAYAVRN